MCSSTLVHGKAGLFRFIFDVGVLKRFSGLVLPQDMGVKVEPQSGQKKNISTPL